MRENEDSILKTKPWGLDLQGSAKVGASKTVVGVYGEETRSIRELGSHGTQVSERFRLEERGGWRVPYIHATFKAIRENTLTYPRYAI